MGNIISHQDEVVTFFHDILGTEGKAFNLWTFNRNTNSKATSWFPLDDEGIQQAAQTAFTFPHGVDVYFSICPSKVNKKILSSRTNSKDVASVNCLWADIDHGTEGHKGTHKDYAAAADDWADVLKKYPPSYIINSGHGLHCYWMLKEPFIIRKPKDIETIKERVKLWQDFLSHEAGHDIDATQDPARVLRVPYTKNYKTTPVETAIIKASRKLYDLSFFPQQKKDPVPKEKPKPTASDPRKTKISKTEINRLIKKCNRDENFSKLFAGNIDDYDSPSEAGQAFFNAVAPRSNFNHDLSCAVFMASALWDHVINEKYKGNMTNAQKWMTTTYNQTVKNYKQGDRIGWAETKVDAKGNTVPISFSDRNVEQILSMHHVTLRYNLLKKENEYSGGGFDGLADDAAAHRLRILCHQSGLYISQQDMRAAVFTIADRYKYNPVADWLTACKQTWDGQDHISKLYGRIHLTPGQDEPLLQLLFRKWLISTVNMAFNDGQNHEERKGATGVLILCGGQAAGKTRFVKSLVPTLAWVGESLAINPASKDSVLACIRYWICELGEIGQTMKRRTRDQLKAFLTAATDTLRRPYGHVTEEIPRHTSFVGTLNDEPDEGFLVDSTGSRRFWVMKIDGIDDPPAGFDLGQLWGQVMNLADKESEYLNKDELKQLAASNYKYDKKTPEEIAILDLFDWAADISSWHYLSSTEVCDHINIGRQNNRRVGRALTHISAADGRIQKLASHRQGRMYLLPPVKKIDAGGLDIPLGVLKDGEL